MDRCGFHALRVFTSLKAAICILGVTFFSSAAKAQSSSSPKLTNLPGAAIRAYYRGKYLKVIKAYEAKEKEALHSRQRLSSMQQVVFMLFRIRPEHTPFIARLF
jgi:negative regulator of sigma E activity